MLLCLCYRYEEEANDITLMSSNDSVVEVNCHFFLNLFSGLNTTVLLNISGLDINLFNKKIMGQG